MWSWVAGVLGGVVVVGLLLWLTLLISMRTGFQPVLTGVRHMNRRVTNPLAMRRAGQPGAKNSVIRHHGRRTGNTYETPIVAVESDSGFAVVLPYGTRPDWLKNVLEAGSATLIHQGTELIVDSPRLVQVEEVESLFSPKDRKVNRLYGIDQVLLLSPTVPAEQTSR